jgi:hypothetical protein
MVQFSFDNVKIKGISSVVPKKEFCLLDDESLYNGDQKKINRVVKSSGFLKRRVNEKDVMTSDLCLKAAEDLLSNLAVDRSEIDALLFVSYTPDYLNRPVCYWTSSDSSIIAIDRYTGEFIVKDIGTAIITVTTSDFLLTDQCLFRTELYKTSSLLFEVMV